MRLIRALLLVVAAAGASCGPTVDLTSALRVDDLATGWADGGVVDGKNKLVPAVSLKLTNGSPHRLPVLQLNAVFRRVDQETEWGTGFLQAAGSKGLEPSASTALLFIRAERGYTGTDPQWALLQNSQFVDAKVDLFAKYGSSKWTRLGVFPIRRVLIER